MPTSHEDLARMLENPAVRISRENRASIASKPKPRVPASKRFQRPPEAGNPRSSKSAALPENVFFVVPGPPCPKPRMTRSDRWRKRPSVLRYRAWADKARQNAQAAVGRGKLPGNRVEIVAYFEMPKSWSKKKKAEMAGRPHRVKPDLDNVIKGLDAIFPDNDSMIHQITACKRWDDGNGARTVITLR